MKRGRAAAMVAGRLGLTAVMIAAMLATAATRVDASARWTVSPTIDEGVSSLLNAVSCVDPTFCVAVGGWSPGTPAGAELIESWDGTNWSVMPSPGVAGQLSAISCTARTSCVAVGIESETGVSPYSTLIEQWNGESWAVVPSIDHAKSVNNELLSVSCAAGRWCIAVGYWQREGSHRNVSLIERWDGTRWHLEPEPEFLPPGDTSLLGVSCPSAGRCFAVGGDDVNNRLLIEQLSNRTWSIVTPPVIGDPTTTGGLAAIDCTGRSSCVALAQVAVGAGPLRARSITWNGTSWASEPTVDVGLADTLIGLSCTTAQHCVAIGTSAGPASPARLRTLVEIWDGTSWAAVHSPNPAPPEHGPEPGGVSCADTRACMVVGFALLHGRERTLGLAGH